VRTRREKTDIEGEERRCRMCDEEKETIEHSWNGCSEIREGEKGSGRNTESRRKGDRMDERYMEKEGQNGKTKGWGIERKMLLFGNYFYF
jgi:hypothetical protein